MGAEAAPRGVTEEEAIVAPADALAHPGAVVVEPLDADVALRAVRGEARTRE